MLILGYIFKASGDIEIGEDFFTDRFSRMTYVYPLKNLTSDIKKQLESFFAHLGLFQRGFLPISILNLLVVRHENI